jgi:hypothetical protein
MAEKYISVLSILEEVYQDEGYAHELDWNDAISWAGKALAKINAPGIFIEKVTGNSLLTPNVVVTDHRGTLPIDFIELLPAGVRDFDSKEVYENSSDSFHNQVVVNNEDLENDTGRLTYILKNNYIETSEKTATLELAYRAFLVDEEGFPMIPDIERVKEAVRTFITFKQDHKLWRLGKISREVYNDSEREWLFYLPSAQNAMRILSPERREIWTRHWTRLLPVISSHDYSYAFLGNREDLNLGFNNDLL